MHNTTCQASISRIQNEIPSLNIDFHFLLVNLKCYTSPIIKFGVLYGHEPTFPICVEASVDPSISINENTVILKSKTILRTDRRLMFKTFPNVL